MVRWRRFPNHIRKPNAKQGFSLAKGAQTTLSHANYSNTAGIQGVYLMTFMALRVVQEATKAVGTSRHSVLFCLYGMWPYQNVQDKKTKNKTKQRHNACCIAKASDRDSARAARRGNSLPDDSYLTLLPASETFQYTTKIGRRTNSLQSATVQ